MSASQQPISQSHRGGDFGIALGESLQAQFTGASAGAAIPTDETTNVLGSSRANFGQSSDGTLIRSQSADSFSIGTISGTPVPHDDDDDDDDDDDG